jgi:hypothetical protein
MKKISSGYNLVHHIFTRNDKSSYSGVVINVLREVNQLLEKNNLTIRFKNSNHFTDDLMKKNEEDIKKGGMELWTEIELYQIEEDK